MNPEQDYSFETRSLKLGISGILIGTIINIFVCICIYRAGPAILLPYFLISEFFIIRSIYPLIQRKCIKINHHYIKYQTSKEKLILWNQVKKIGNFKFEEPGYEWGNYWIYTIYIKSNNETIIINNRYGITPEQLKNIFCKISEFSSQYKFTIQDKLNWLN